MIKSAENGWDDTKKRPGGIGSNIALVILSGNKKLPCQLSDKIIEVKEQKVLLYVTTL